MHNEQINILLIEDDPQDADLFQELLSEEGAHAFNLEWVDRLHVGLARLAEAKFDLVVLDLDLPDTHGFESYTKVQAQAPNVPIVVLSDLADETITRKAIQEGVQDYVVKGGADGRLLIHILHHAIERKRAEEVVKESLLLIERIKKEWETTVDSLSQFVCLFDYQGCIIRANRTVERWGLAKVVGIKGRNLHHLFHPDCNDLTCYFKSLWPQAKEALTEGRSIECEVEDKILKRYLHLQIQPITGQTIPENIKQDSFGVMVIQDITQRKQAEDDLRKAHDELEQRVKERTAHLSQTNEVLKQEINKRSQAELENARLYAETQNLANELALLNKAGQTMTSSLDLHTVLKQTMIEANALMGTEGSSVLLSDPVSNELAFAAVTNPDSKTMVGNHVSLASSIAGWVVQNKQSILVNDVQNDLRFYDRTDSAAGSTTRSILAVPLIVRDEVIGVIESTNKVEGDFTKHDLELLEALASSAAIAVDNARLFEQVQFGREQMRRLAHKVVMTQEEERQRLSHELHDEAGQVMVALKLMLEMIQMDAPLEIEAFNERISEAVELTDTITERVRSLARDLRPPMLDAAGLGPTLEGLCQDFARWAKLTIEYSGTEPDILSDPAKITLYRFLQESLTNIAKHAQAKQVYVKLDSSHRLVSLTVQDNGRGFSYQPGLDIPGGLKGIGLLGMKERLELVGGRLEIESQPGHGTSLTAYIPLEDN